MDCLLGGVNTSVLGCLDLLYCLPSCPGTSNLTLNLTICRNWCSRVFLLYSRDENDGTTWSRYKNGLYFSIHALVTSNNAATPDGGIATTKDKITRVVLSRNTESTQYTKMCILLISHDLHVHASVHISTQYTHLVTLLRSHDCLGVTWLVTWLGI